MYQKKSLGWLFFSFLIFSMSLYPNQLEWEWRPTLNNEVIILLERLDEQSHVNLDSGDEDRSIELIELKDRLWLDLQECWNIFRHLEGAENLDAKNRLEEALRKIVYFRYYQDGHTIDDTALAKIAALCPNLQALDLVCSECITDMGLAHLTSLSKLQWLSLNGSKKITDDGIAHLAKLSLRCLDLGWCPNITDRGLAYLADTAIRSLHLAGLRITDNGVSHLVNLPLESLSLNNTRITDAGLIYLMTMPLENLYLAACNGITDTGLDCLIGLPLQSLGLNRCQQVTDAKKMALCQMGIYIH